MSSLALDFLTYVEKVPAGNLAEVLDRILDRIRSMTGAEAGTIFILRNRYQQEWLDVLCSQNDRVPIEERDLRIPVTTDSIAGWVATMGQTLQVDDVYDLAEGDVFQFNPAFDRRTGYRSRSMLVFPLRSFEGAILGVVQLLNRVDPQTGEIVPFDVDQLDFLQSINQVMSRAIERVDMLDRIRAQNRELEESNRRLIAANAQTEEAFMLSIRLLARAAEIHDDTTGLHVQRVGEYSRYMAQIIGKPDDFCDEIHYSSQLHDIGKMTIDFAILKKKGRLTDEEFATMQNHTRYGYDILSAHPRLAMSARIALYHHEKWDGSGYPEKLAGEEIPLEARITQVADIYDALRSERPYKPGFDHAKTRDILLNGDDRIKPQGQFDPQLLELFRDHHTGFAAIWDRLNTPDEGPS